MKQKRCAELHIPYYNPQTTGVWSLIELASLYTVSLSAVNGFSRFTKLTTSKGVSTADLTQKCSNRPIPFESNRTADPNSNRIAKLRRSLEQSYQSSICTSIDAAFCPHSRWTQCSLTLWFVMVSRLGRKLLRNTRSLRTYAGRWQAWRATTRRPGLVALKPASTRNQPGIPMSGHLPHQLNTGQLITSYNLVLVVLLLLWFFTGRGAPDLDPDPAGYLVNLVDQGRIRIRPDPMYLDPVRHWIWPDLR